MLNSHTFPDNEKNGRSAGIRADIGSAFEPEYDGNPHPLAAKIGKMPAFHRLQGGTVQQTVAAAAADLDLGDGTGGANLDEQHYSALLLAATGAGGVAWWWATGAVGGDGGDA